MKYILEALNSQRILQAHLKAAQANAEPKLLKELTKPTQKKKKFLKMPHRTTVRQMRTRKIGHKNHYRQESTGGNSTYKKLAVQWLNEALCFVSSSVLADSFRLRNRQLLVAANRY
jgi:hypothetical protein